MKGTCCIQALTVPEKYGIRYAKQMGKYVTLHLTPVNNYCRNHCSDQVFLSRIHSER